LPSTDNAWAEDAVSATLNEAGLSAGADSELPDEARFVRRVREILTAAAAKHGPLSAPALYVFAPSREDKLADIATFRRRIHTGEIDPAGCIWFVGAAARSAYSMPLDGRSTDEIFQYCEDLGFGRSPAVYCDTSSAPPSLAWYPSGLSEPDDLIEGPIYRAARPTLDELIEVVDRVHRTRFMTSLNQGLDTSLWTDGDKHWPHPRAEKRVQDALMAGIGGAFGRPYFVEQEKSGDAGRFDIGFRERAGGGTSTLHAILELKVAKSFSGGGVPVSAADTEARVISGVEQVWAYADEHEAGERACLVFDLRTPDAQVPPEPARIRAAALKVLLKFWRCFPTAEDYRTFKVPSAP
jgi:hypothetical protein